MSLELAVKENTAAIRALIAVMAAAGTATCSQEAVAETPVAEDPQPEALPVELVYADIQKPFLKLVQKSREDAVALLEGFKFKTLKDAKPAQFAAVLEKIEAALG